MIEGCCHRSYLMGFIQRDYCVFAGLQEDGKAHLEEITCGFLVNERATQVLYPIM